MPEFAFSLSKHVHVWCVTLSFLLFLTRASWRLKESPMLQQAWVKIVPHCIDTLLLLTGILMSVQLYGSSQPLPLWLICKWVFIGLYIVTGLYAFGGSQNDSHKKPSKTKAFIAAAICFFCAAIYLAIQKPSL